MFTSVPAVGDIMLKAFADVLASRFRASGLLARIGGIELRASCRDRHPKLRPVFGENAALRQKSPYLVGSTDGGRSISVIEDDDELLAATIGSSEAV